MLSVLLAHEEAYSQGHFLKLFDNRTQLWFAKLWALSMDQPQSEKNPILEQEDASNHDIMKIHNEENNLSDLMNIDQHRTGLPPTTVSEQQSVSAGSGTAENSESMLPEIDAKERLQRFDLVIQHLHRLRATLALDSSVRELQKLQTLNILGQNLLQPLTQHGHAGPPELKQLLHAQHSSPHSVPVPQPPGHHGKIFYTYLGR